MDFMSDNTAPVSPEIFDALNQMNACMETSRPYGADGITAALKERLSLFFEKEVFTLPVASGTAANALSLSMLAGAGESVVSYCSSHVQTSECGAVEFYTGGRLSLVGGEDGKISLPLLKSLLAQPSHGFHGNRHKGLTLTQATEMGTVYSCEEITALSALAHNAGMKVHMDGARLANAVAYLDCSPADITWKSGVDILSLGTSKNGTINGEVIVVFDKRLIEENDLFRFAKRGGHISAKMRYVSQQVLAWLEDELWLRNAAHANDMVCRLLSGISSVESISVEATPQTNQLFLRMPESMVSFLEEQGALFYRWEEGENPCIRLVTSFNTAYASVDKFIDTVLLFEKNSSSKDKGVA